MADSEKHKDVSTVQLIDDQRYVQYSRHSDALIHIIEISIMLREQRSLTCANELMTGLISVGVRSVHRAV